MHSSLFDGSSLAYCGKRCAPWIE